METNSCNKSGFVPDANSRCYRGVFKDADKIANQVSHGSGRLNIVRMRRGTKSTQIRCNKVIVILGVHVNGEEVYL